jgi:hypothetical protein
MCIETLRGELPETFVEQLVFVKPYCFIIDLSSAVSIKLV